MPRPTSLASAVSTLEADVLRAQIGADALQEVRERHTTPLADGAPALDANVPRDLLLLWHGTKVGQRATGHRAQLRGAAFILLALHPRK